GFLDKKSPPHVRGPVSFGFFDENNVCAAVMEESDGLRTADFQVWARRRSKESGNETIWIVSERPFSRKTAASGGSRFELICLYADTEVTSLCKNDHKGLRHGDGST
ncbi:MAG: hypothetical protein ACXWNF_08400, partial [Isosphaeraceae bacterium]